MCITLAVGNLNHYKLFTSTGGDAPVAPVSATLSGSTSKCDATPDGGNTSVRNCEMIASSAVAVSESSSTVEE